MEVVNILNKVLDDYGVNIIEDRNRKQNLLADIQNVTG